MPIIRILLLLLPLVELAGLIVLGQFIGVGYTLLWVLASGLLGIIMIQRQGWGMLQRLQTQMAQNRAPLSVLKSGMWGVLAGVLLVIPGVVTDLLALPALIMALRHRNKAQPGEPGGPQVWKQGEHNVIEGEWAPGTERRPEKHIDKE
ncbi:MAG TPA: FxsA family protein [Pseudomonas xinjiangensis]|uniref:FxsA family protein n=2 Tax=root TaxID=1 RepID=A0A7V1FS17_9GAMM|nr:FxsA family protein [Halopseudomonas xinjiangensis]HEC47939.1 FxsA family protein [Halopseudomonas xinjiangensis]